MTKSTVKRAISYRHLTLNEREEIVIGLERGYSLCVIAKSIGRSVSTISRECTRNQPSCNKVKYRANQAHIRSQDRQEKSHRRARLKSEGTRQYVAEKLAIGWTPELIAGRIKREGLLVTTNHESIYQWIYSDRRDLINHLPRSHRKRRKRGSAKYKHASKIPNRIPLENRSDLANSRQEPGHWEADTAVSRQSKAAIAVMVERTTRLIKIYKLPSKSALCMQDALIQSFQSVPTHLRKSITYDNGTENTAHASVNQALGTLSFFVSPTIPGKKALLSSLLALSGAPILKKLTGTWSLSMILILSKISSIIVQENVLTFYHPLRPTLLHLLLERGVAFQFKP